MHSSLEETFGAGAREAAGHQSSVVRFIKPVPLLIHEIGKEKRDTEETEVGKGVRAKVIIAYIYSNAIRMTCHAPKQ